MYIKTYNYFIHHYSGIATLATPLHPHLLCERDQAFSDDRQTSVLNNNIRKILSTSLIFSYANSFFSFGKHKTGKNVIKIV